MNILKLLKTDGFIMYNKELARKIGLHESIVLGQLSSIANLFNFEEFFFQQEKIAYEVTLSVKQVRCALKKLKSLGLLTITKKGLPRKNWYYLHADKLEDFFDENESSSDSDKECLVKQNLPDTASRFCLQCQANFAQHLKDNTKDNTKDINLKSDTSPNDFSEELENKSFDEQRELLNLSPEDKFISENLPKELSNQIFDIFQKGAMPCANGNKISFLMRDFKNGMNFLQKDYSYLTHSEIIQACRNYVAVVNSPLTWINQKLSFERFVRMKNFADFLPSNYIYTNFLNWKEQAEQKQVEVEEENDKNYEYEPCPNCKMKRLKYISDRNIIQCVKCKSEFSYHTIYPWAMRFDNE